MTEEPSRPVEPKRPETGGMPRWVPIAIGVVLVTLAALAVVTGLRYRDDTLVGMVQSRRAPQSAAAPPGEPEAGGSRIMSGIPAANVPGDEETHYARRGMTVKGAAGDAIVYINDMPVGRARELDSEDEVYDFAEPGSYTVRIIAPGQEERRFVVTVNQAAEEEIAVLDVASPPARP